MINTSSIVSSVQSFVYSTKNFIDLLESGVKFLDLRPKFNDTYRLRGSYYIPACNLLDRLHELCPRSRPVSIIGDQSQVKEADLLDAKGWKIETFVVSDFIDWEFAEVKKHVKKANDTSKAQVDELLFEPSFFLKKSLTPVLKVFKESETIQVLDLGCGFGRDISYLCLLDKRIKATGVDMNANCQEKVLALFENLGIADQLNFVYRIKFKHNGSTNKMVLKSFDPEESLESLNDSTSKCHGKADEVFDHHYDIVLMIRFYEPKILEFLHNRIFSKSNNKNSSEGNRPKYLVLSYFVDHPSYSYTKPKVTKRIKYKEVSTWLEKNGYVILVDELQEIEDGRPVNCILAKK